MALSRNDVFVTNGVPEHTYIPRDTRRLEDELKDAVATRRVAILSGHTKSGKSVLAEKIFPPVDAVWINGGDVRDLDDFWGQVISAPRLGGATVIRRTRSETDRSGDSVGYGGSVNVAVAAARLGGEKSRAREETTQIQTESAAPPHIVAPRRLESEKIPLVVDDFHLIDKDVQKQLTGMFKGMSFRGAPLVLLTLPQYSDALLRYVPEMLGRVCHVRIPPWDEDELLEIPRRGFALLNLELAVDVGGVLARAAQRCPNLMQEFCRQMCVDNRIREKRPRREVIGFSATAREFFLNIAENGMGGEIYRRLKAGPPRRGRKQWPFRGGGTGDIYQVVVRALARLQRRKKEGNFSEQELRGELERLLVPPPPQAASVSHALSKMSGIRMSAQDSDTVLDWNSEERRIYINDPYLAFYLSWVVNGG